MPIEELQYVEITQRNLQIFKNLAQAYGAEFSNLTHIMPNELGLFEPAPLPATPYVGYLVYYQQVPVGFCVADVHSEVKDIAEFYIIPVMRKKKLGQQLACMLFDKYRGTWQVRQISGANEAIHFWRSVIGKYTNHTYEEEKVNDPEWGLVTRQLFRT